jgi:hypothetical protein
MNNFRHFSKETVSCNFSEILRGKVRLSSIYNDINVNDSSYLSYLDRILDISITKEHALYQSAYSSLKLIISDSESKFDSIDFSTLESIIIRKQDTRLKEQILHILPLAYKERYGDENDILYDFRQVSESPHEATIVVTCRDLNGNPVVLSTIRLDYNPNPDEMETLQFFSFSTPLKTPCLELCRFAFHPIFDIWFNSSNPDIRRRSLLLRGLLTRMMYLKGCTLFDNPEEQTIICTMTRNVAFFMKRISGFTITPIKDSKVNVHNEYFLAEQVKYPKYFIPEQMNAYILEFNLDAANIELPKDMLLSVNE